MVETYSPKKQYSEAKGVRHLGLYGKLHDKVFRDGSWKKRFSDELYYLASYGYRPSEDFFRYSAFTDIWCGQYGWPSLDGRILNFAANSRLEICHPRHHLALACYAANLNLQALEFKEEMAKRLKPYGKDYEKGAWGFFFKTRGGVMQNLEGSDEALIQALDLRIYEEHRPIYMPDKKRSERIAVLNFKPNDAERMTDSEFEQTIIPYLSQRGVMGDVLNVEKAFEWRGPTGNKAT